MIKNPVLSGFHADPSLLYVDGMFYVANSTFEYFPGVKISASTDLANWKTVGYPLDNPRLLDMQGNPKSTGIWAPCLTYSEGLFYLVYTDVKDWSDHPYKDTPNYITTAKDIKGPWSDPIYINCSGFDPSLFHDDDGQKYFVSMEWDYRKKGSEQFSGILLTKLNPVTLEPVAEPVKIFAGSVRGFVEGPHLYKKDGYYYLFTAEGGTEYKHATTVARSKTIDGEYTIHPNTHLVCAEGSPPSALQKTGHGSMTQSADGRWWFACLCGRPLEGTLRCPLGRETAINELVWEDGWPYIKNKSLLLDIEFEGYGEKAPPSPIDYDFKEEQFLLDFQFLRTKPKFSVEDDGVLRIWGGNSPVCNFGQNVLLRRQTDFNFEASTSVKLNGKNFQQMAGFMYRYDEKNHYFLRVSYDEKKGRHSLGLICMDNGSFSMPVDFELPAVDGAIHMKLTVKGKDGVFAYSLDGNTYTDIPYVIDVSKLSDDYTEPLGFTGAFLGMGCIDMRDKTAWADFNYFKYIPQ